MRGVFSIQFFNIIRGWILSNAEYLCIASATQFRIAYHISRLFVRRPKEPRAEFFGFECASQAKDRNRHHANLLGRNGGRKKWAENSEIDVEPTHSSFVSENGIGNDNFAIL